MYFEPEKTQPVIIVDSFVVYFVDYRIDCQISCGLDCCFGCVGSGSPS